MAKMAARLSGGPSQGLRLGCRPFGLPPRGADPGLAGRGPERGTTGTN